MLTIRTLDDGLPLVEAEGDLDEGALDDLAKALLVLDAEPAIIVSLARCAKLDETSVRGALEASQGLAGYVIFIVPRTPECAHFASLSSDRPTLHVVDDLGSASSFGRAVREANAVEFSKDGIASGS